MAMTLGIDLACRAAHVASLAGPDGALVWRGRSLFTRPADLEKLWRDIDCPPGPASPTCNSIGGVGPHGFLRRFQAAGLR